MEILRRFNTVCTPLLQFLLRVYSIKRFGPIRVGILASSLVGATVLPP
jgi:hypothetical protein